MGLFLLLCVSCLQPLTAVFFRLPFLVHMPKVPFRMRCTITYSNSSLLLNMTEWARDTGYIWYELGGTARQALPVSGRQLYRGVQVLYVGVPAVLQSFQGPLLFACSAPPSIRSFAALHPLLPSLSKNFVHPYLYAPKIRYSNKVMILQLDDQKGVFKESATFDHPYPTTKVRVYT